jgi:hypothetical protein
MSRLAADLPEDPAELRRFAAALAAEVHDKTLLIEKLRMQLAILRRARFGRSLRKARSRDRATGVAARRHGGERRCAADAFTNFRRRGCDHAAVAEEAVPARAFARSSAA